MPSESSQKPSVIAPIKKLLVCNRGEIAIRVFRSCTELGIRTVAIYSHEDRFSLHRYKADEAYPSGASGSPVQAYLDIERIIAIARHAGADAIHPGYGFLSEREELCVQANKAGIRFVGPSPETLDIAGDKTKTISLAKSIGVPTIPGTEGTSSLEEAKSFAEKVGYPVIIKAAFGGGGRGMRRVDSSEELESSYEVAAAEAKSAFGRDELFLEKFIDQPQHIEVQLLGDGTGEVVHLFERDCSLQRRHQKVIECAPALGISDETKNTLYRHATALGRALKLRSAATAEFLVSKDGSAYFIEVNPRIQVEHTVTEEVTGIDLVRSQIQIAEGATLSSLGLEQDSLRCSGHAIQCRITTENPANNFTPDYGKLLAYRSASGFGIRLDAGSAFTGAEITPFYDSMLVKVTSSGRTKEEAASRMRRALSEFRIRGVNTNIAFLENLLRHPSFLAGSIRTPFLEENPSIFELPKRRDRANRLLHFLADVTVNGHESMPNIKRPAQVRFPDKRWTRDEMALEAVKDESIPPGWRDIYLSEGKQEFLRKVRETQSLLITDTTMRDAHQSLFATRMRTHDMMAVARKLAVSAPQLFSLEMWGGATFDVMLRFLREDPWKRLSKLREEVPNILFQMLLRGANGVGYTSYPNNVIRRFILESHKSGIDIFRIFDSLNSVDRMRNAIDSVQEAGGIAEVCLCFTGDLLAAERANSPEEAHIARFNLQYFVDLAGRVEEAGADIIAIKDMAGLLRPYSAELLVKTLRAQTKLPIHFHTHDTAGVQSASYLKAAEADVDIVDCAFAAMSGVTSQPSLEGIVAALDNTPRSTGLDLESLTSFSSYWEAVRTFYAPFESDLRSATGEVYSNEIPGGQYSNFRPQAESLGLGDKWSELKKAYAAVNRLFGGIVKVTPSSKVVGDMAIFMVSNGLTAEDVLERASELDVPASVVEFFQGKIGVPEGGLPVKLRDAILRGKPIVDSDLSEQLEPADFDKAVAEASDIMGRKVGIRDALSYLLYPHVFKQYAQARKDFANLRILPTMPFFYGLEEGEEVVVDLEPGKRLFICLNAISEPGEDGERTVFFELNGQPRNIQIRDRSIVSTVRENPVADPSNPLHIGAALAGVLVSMDVSEGDVVNQDDALFTLEAMKMQTVVRAPRPGKVATLHVAVSGKVDAGDLVIEFADE
jgi:pyruvate carboxylase